MEGSVRICCTMARRSLLSTSNSSRGNVGSRRTWPRISITAGNLSFLAWIEKLTEPAPAAD